MSILVIGDPHFKINNGKDTTIMMEKIIDLIKERKPDAVVLLGDVMHTHEQAHIDPFIRACDALVSMAELVITYVLIGNHDLRNNTEYLSKKHFLAPLKYVPNLVIVDVPIKFSIREWNFIAVPYTPPGMFQNAIDTLELPTLDDISMIFAHQEFHGCKNGPKPSVIGDVWPDDNPLVVSGHIHDYCELKDNILYIGTPIKHNFGGEKLDKTVSWFTFGDELKKERIGLGLPAKYKKIIMSEQIASYKPNVEPGVSLKVVINCKLGEKAVIEKHPNVVLWKSLGYIVQCTVRRGTEEFVDLADSIFDPDVNVRCKSFRESLYEDIAEDEDLVNAFNCTYSLNK